MDNPLYKGIWKLPPGSYVKLGSKEIGERNYKVKKYWDILEIAENNVANPFGGTNAEAINGLDTLLSKAVREQMVADVPLGAFLSGGVDS